MIFCKRNTMNTHLMNMVVYMLAGDDGSNRM